MYNIMILEKQFLKLNHYCSNSRKIIFKRIFYFQIDLDTIDVSNLNRQFLFQKKHVGKSKADVARETALTFNPDAKIVHYHDSITTYFHLFIFLYS